MAEGAPEKISSFRLFLVPTLWILVVPVSGYAFSVHYLSEWNAEARASVRETTPSEEISKDPAAFDAKLASLDLGAVAFNACGSFGFTERPAGFGPGFCNQFLQFAWVRRLGKGLLGLSAVAGLVLAALLAWASRSARKQHLAFGWGWNILRAFGIPHIIGQGLILLFLSFWVTAIWFDMYYVKVVGAAGFMAAYAAYVAFKALFQRSLQIPREHGGVLREADAPDFFGLVRELANKLGTHPPQNIVLGIDDNFFVTESPLDIFEKYPSKRAPNPSLTRVEGRTLYTSLSLMRVLHVDETRAVLAHELGHFALGDTQQSRALNPLLQRFGLYLRTLSQTPSFGVASFMAAFRAAFELIVRRHGRLAEFAADGVARDLVGAAPTAGALVRVAAYSTYRGETESSLIESMQKHGVLNIRDRVRSGFSTFVSSTKTHGQLLEQRTPHPFDSHPPLLERLEALGVPAPSPSEVEQLSVPVAASAIELIPAVESIESKLWTAYEEDFQEKHDFIIALRLLPKTPEEVAHVERHFPSVEMAMKKGTSLRVTWEGVVLPGGLRVDFEELKKVERDNEAFKGDCIILHTALTKHRIVLSEFVDKGASFVSTFQSHWNRHLTAMASTAASPAPAGTDEIEPRDPPPSESSST